MDGTGRDDSPHRRAAGSEALNTAPSLREDSTVRAWSWAAAAAGGSAPVVGELDVAGHAAVLAAWTALQLRERRIWG
jgi:hypothetical protein